ncbi:MAG: DUF3530 family protein [Marinospirillum sp.]|uniref:DUF3530 family protein n=1 Tax=Marinospirillum sp. TaxID=2183934 RepID=UPI001A0C8574|nr:DUF3530 family protein [Marinospirillum sp.]MBE0506773.1 DUF3530 family protein [Marinospirillum sp.]
MNKLLLPFLLLLIILPVGANMPSGFGFDDEEDETPPVVRSEPDPMRAMLTALIAEVPSVQQVNLPLAEDQQFLALEIKALRPRPRGQLLILPADGLHPDWPQAIAPVRRNLPEYGWTTLSLSLPVYKALGVAPRTLPPGPLLARMTSKIQPLDNATEKGEAAMPGGMLGMQEEEEEAPVVVEREDPAVRLTAHRELIEARVAAALEHLGPGGRKGLVLQGESVYWLQPWLEAGNLNRRSPLILLQVESPEGADASSLVTTLQQLGNRPILDIYDARNARQQYLADERKAAYRRAGNRQAVQMPMNFDQSSAVANHWLAQRIEGWLRSL